jgi:hypothetical protein
VIYIQAEVVEPNLALQAHLTGQLAEAEDPPEARRFQPPLVDPGDAALLRQGALARQDGANGLIAGYGVKMSNGIRDEEGSCSARAESRGIDSSFTSSDLSRGGQRNLCIPYVLIREGAALSQFCKITRPNPWSRFADTSPRELPVINQTCDMGTAFNRPRAAAAGLRLRPC